jgi:RNA polymerase sigma-70 factor (ECF subfamily)
MATDLRRPPAVLDPASFDLFYRRHLGEIYRFVLHDVGNRADAEEVTQNAFLDAFRALRRGHEPEMPRAWMYGIARNAARRRYRTQSRRPREVELAPDVLEGLSQREEGPWVEAVRAAFANLRDSHRDALFLREVEGLSYAEIAERMDLSQSAVETLLFRARRALREAFEAEGLRPAVRRSPLERVKGLALLPAAFLGRLAERMQQLLSPEVVSKTAGAATAIALGTGVAVGTHQALPDDPPVKGGDAAPASPLAAGTDAATLPPWLEPALPDAASKASNPERRAKVDGKRDRREDLDRPAAGGSETGGGAGAGSADGGGSSGGSSGGDGGGTSVSTPPVSVPAVQAPAPPAAPPVTTPPIEVPSVEVEVPVDSGGLLGG